VELDEPGVRRALGTCSLRQDAGLAGTGGGTGVRSWGPEQGGCILQTGEGTAGSEPPSVAALPCGQ
jgi:hypothetical protein